MSDLETKQLAAEMLRGALNRKPKPGTLHLWLGVIYPAAVIVFELATRWCAQSFFDPMPTWAHALAVAAVPAGNFFLWLALRDRLAVDPRWLALASGLSLGVAALYALVFLPLMPLAMIGIILYGIGLLPLAPLASLLSAARLGVSLRDRYPGRALGRTIGSGFGAAVAVLIALDVPAAATRIGVGWAASQDEAQRQRGLALLRTVGDDDLLLRLCYEAVGRPSGLLSAFVMFGGTGLFGVEADPRAQSTTTVREIFYRVTGEPFNARPAPFEGGTWARFAEFQWDNDHGGTEVGGRIKGLDLVASRIDGTIDAADAVSYLEWIVEYRNVSGLDREARVEFALPPGGVVSRATLWVNGEEREAAYAGRGEARAAYERVAVQQRRDPLLVTTKGADRVLAQAFPVPRNGGSIRFKIGITAPLELGNDGKAHLTLPAILDRNFSFASSTPHTVWIESKTPIEPTQGTTPSRTGEGFHRVELRLDDGALARKRPVITVVRPADAVAVAARLGHGPEIIQEIAARSLPQPSAMMVVIDGSRRIGPRADAIALALEKIPDGTPAGVIIAGDGQPQLRIAPWSKAQRAKAQALIREADYHGGQDNAPALKAALQALEPHEGAILLWVHGPQPVAFRDTASLLEQASGRLTRRPQLWLYATDPGPNQLLPDLPLGWSARHLPARGSPETEIADFFTRAFSSAPRPVVERHLRLPVLASEVVPALPRGSDHIARLWARDEVLSLAGEKGEGRRKAAIELAAEHRLVTPVSGAVVLETRQQFAEMGLTPVPQSSVPTVPEPHEWALILMSAAALLWLMWRQRMERVAA